MLNLLKKFPSYSKFKNKNTVPISIHSNAICLMLSSIYFGSGLEKLKWEHFPYDYGIIIIIIYVKISIWISV
jgi:hypothetical protein